ncbi:pyridine nucleotide-disulfide oxidoreductase-like protein [Lasiosphaeria ovina]|uniref:Pyridine nucleotide-disulfide oxidoreductase-like protein n=1 Tax=Lasiosphaeria ovina TaxID=92902 RepID=A0AAE0JYX7_9PEZI|nr:pyridine nucleotide-disulfide oxidoreductase-like protein [Lasiosphaeria ovina]
MASDESKATGGESQDDATNLRLQQKYAEEAAKRFRSDGVAQFVDLKDASSDRVRALKDDPWADHSALNAKPAVKDGARYKFIILGAGYGGLIYAANLVKSGVVSGEGDVLFLDAAGGFGGTWYWNRYPGLHCDIESYVYMPLLEETGYIPKNKYADGPELLDHANRIAKHFDLDDKALFRTTVQSAHWNDESKVWHISITEDRGPEEESRRLELEAQYFFIASGVLTVPHAPKIPSLETFSGYMFHTSRWDYSVSGGKPDNWNLTGLQGKRVGIIGTGATAIQVVPQLAKLAKEVYVFQRTPSSVSWRGQRPTDPEEWKTKIAAKKGWQIARMKNMDRFLTDAAREGEENLVADSWSRVTAYSALVGSPRWGIIEPTPEKIDEHVARLYKLDQPYTEQVRARTATIVKDPDTAARLTAWYPSWCKRVTFSDEYLQVFNLPHVHLVDTEGKGVDSATKDGLVVAGKEYPLDILVLSTGFRTPGHGGGNPAERADIRVFGREGKSLHDKWDEQGASTLHGLYTNGFPNLFFSAVAQTGQAANFVFTVTVWAEHIAQVVADAERAAGPRAVVEVKKEAEEAWAVEIMKRAAWYTSILGCTPGYITSEGQALQTPKDAAEMVKKARSSGWSEGMESFIQLLEKYRAEGSLRAFEVVSATAS